MGTKPAAKSAKTANTTKAEKPVEAAKKGDVVVRASAATKKKAKKVVAAEAAHKSSLCREDSHCKIKGCKRTYRAKGYCQTHYRKWRRGEYGMARYKTCKDVECRKPIVLNKKGYCETHYENYIVKGNAQPVAAAPAEKAAIKEEKVAASA